MKKEEKGALIAELDEKEADEACEAIEDLSMGAMPMASMVPVLNKASPQEMDDLDLMMMMGGEESKTPATTQVVIQPASIQVIEPASIPVIQAAAEA